MLVGQNVLVNHMEKHILWVGICCWMKEATYYQQIGRASYINNCTDCLVTHRNTSSSHIIFSSSCRVPTRFARSEVQPTNDNTNTPHYLTRDRQQYPLIQLYFSFFWSHLTHWVACFDSILNCLCVANMFYICYLCFTTPNALGYDLAYVFCDFSKCVLSFWLLLRLKCVLRYSKRVLHYSTRVLRYFKMCFHFFKIIRF